MVARGSFPFVPREVAGSGTKSATRFSPSVPSADWIEQVALLPSLTSTKRGKGIS